jgi:predicted nucleic acid-binding protein
MPIVSNSTPLIALSRIGRLDVLRDLFEEIMVPAEVYDELVVKGKDRPGSEVISAAGWIRRRHVQDANPAADLISRGWAGEKPRPLRWLARQAPSA